MVWLGQSDEALLLRLLADEPGLTTPDTTCCARTGTGR
jgi:hypothetical protein